MSMDDSRKDAASEVRRLRRLLEASRLLHSTLELAELTKIVLRILQDELPVERCTLFVLDRRQRLLRSMVAQGVEQFEIVLTLGEGLAGNVALTGEPLDVDDACADERFHPGFDRRFGFHTNDAIGTGLGLAVSRRIIEQHNGKLSFHTAPHLGTTFSIEIPVQQAAKGMTAGR